VVATLSATSSLTLLTLITICLLSSVRVVPDFVDRIDAIPSPVDCPLVATAAHVCVDGGSIERVSSCARREPIVPCSSAIWSLRCCCSDSNVARSLRISPMILFWFSMILFHYSIVSFKLAMSTASSPIPVLLLSGARPGENETRPVGIGGRSYCVRCCCVLSGSLFCGSRNTVALLPLCTG
jgi:hypothetical protein